MRDGVVFVGVWGGDMGVCYRMGEAPGWSLLLLVLRRCLDAVWAVLGVEGGVIWQPSAGA